MTPQQQLDQLRNQAARLQNQRKSAEPIFRKMVAITTKQLRKENREDRRRERASRH